MDAKDLRKTLDKLQLVHNREQIVYPRDDNKPAGGSNIARITNNKRSYNVRFVPNDSPSTTSDESDGPMIQDVASEPDQPTSDDPPSCIPPEKVPRLEAKGGYFVPKAHMKDIMAMQDCLYHVKRDVENAMICLRRFNRRFNNWNREVPNPKLTIRRKK